MACFCMRVELVPSIISSLLTASGAALSIVFGMLQKNIVFLKTPKDTSKNTKGS